MSAWRAAGPRGVMRRVPPVLWLAAVWTMLWGRWSWGTAAAGVLVAIAITVLLPLPRVVLGGRVHPWGVIRFAVRFVRDLVISSVQVSWWALGPAGSLRNAVVAIELRSRSDLLVTITSEALTLVPGSIVIDVDRPRSTIYAHVLGVRGLDDVERFRRDVLALEERVIRAFGAPTRRGRGAAPAGVAPSEDHDAVAAGGEPSGQDRGEESP